MVCVSRTEKERRLFQKESVVRRWVPLKFLIYVNTTTNETGAEIDSHTHHARSRTFIHSFPATNTRTT